MRKSINHLTTEKTPSSEHLPIVPLLILAITSFIATANEIVPAGLLPQIALGFAVSQAWAGQLVSACALGSGLAAIPLTLAFRRWSRKNILIFTLCIFFLGNALTAISSHYGLTLIARFSIGLATGLAWSQLASYARLMVAPSLQGRALAVAMAGIPVALSFGVPLSAWAGTFLNWQTVFAVLAGLTLLLMVAAALMMPNSSGDKKAPAMALTEVLRLPGVITVLSLVMVWILAHYLLYTYIAPLLNAAGLLSYLDRVLLLFGLSALAGLWVVGRLIDNHLPVLIGISLSLFAVALCVLGFGGASPGRLLVAVSVWGFSFSGAPTLLQTLLAKTSGSAADVAQSMLVTIFNLAFAASGVLGGLIISFFGVATLPWVALALVMVALGCSWRAQRHHLRPLPGSPQ